MVVQSGIKYYVSGKKWVKAFFAKNARPNIFLLENVLGKNNKYTNEKNTRMDTNKEKSHVSIRNHS